MIATDRAGRGLSEWFRRHTSRSTGITSHRKNGGTIEHARRIADHAGPRTTRPYDRTGDRITLDEIERIGIEHSPIESEHPTVAPS